MTYKRQTFAILFCWLLFNSSLQIFHQEDTGFGFNTEELSSNMFRRVLEQQQQQQKQQQKSHHNNDNNNDNNNVTCPGFRD
jgi:hypothetical protein